MREISIDINEDGEGHRVRSVLFHFGVSQSLIKKLKNDPEGIMLNGEPVRTIDYVKSGDELKIRIPDTGSHAEPSDAKLEVLYEDEDVIAVNKPPGMPVHESHNHQGDALSNAYAAYCPDSAAFRAIYRLDMDTSGIVLIAKNIFAASKLAGNVKKDYYAVVEGDIDRDGEIDLPIKRIDERLTKRCVSPDGERALTRYHVIRHDKESTFLKINIETGRTHQIRVHFANAGHPLLGDDLYGGDMTKTDRQALHCKDIYFTHPVTGENIHVASEFPDDFKELI